MLPQILSILALCMAAASSPTGELAAGPQPPTEAVAGSPADAPASVQPAALLDVGAPAPEIQATTWLNGGPVAVTQRGQSPVFVITFWASWSGPSRAALPQLVSLNEQYSGRGVVFVGVTEEPADAVRAFLKDLTPALPFRIAIDDDGATTRAYCAAAAVAFVPYTFVVGPDRTLAWHGHPMQDELGTIIEQLLTGKYDRSRAQELVQRFRSVDQLESLFRDAYANESWHTALLALDALLQTDVPKTRLLRYKLSILLGELNEYEQAHTLADELRQRYAGSAKTLNSIAWDIVSQPRLYLRAPEIGFELARDAYRASGGQDASVADTYARALHMIGRVDLAIEVQQRAVETCGPGQRERHEEMLSFYQRCAALQKGATADPK